MSKFYFSKLAILAAILVGCNYNLSAQVTTVFTFNGTTGTGGAGISGTPQSYTVPSGISQLAIDMYGAAGGWPCCSWSSSGSNGPRAYGGRVQCTLAVTPGQVLYVYVGGHGGDNYNTGTQSPGGWNGGGTGGASTSAFCAGGGGASDIRTSTTAPYGASNVLVVAGAGGGGGDFSPVGGAGGGLTGGTGQAYPCLCTTNGTCGGGQTGPSCTVGALGTQGQGGSCTCYSYGGGGGGWWGGNGGASGDYAGGGGSSYTNPTLCSGVVHTQGYSSATSNGQVTITTICNPPLAGVISGATSVCNGSSATLSDSQNYTDGAWSSSNTAVATVGTGGVVTSVSVGTALISFSTVRACGSAYDVTTVTVNPPVTSITGNANICTATPSTLTGAPTGGVWTSSNSGVAGVGSSSGLVSGFTAGLATMTYTLPAGCFGTLGVAVYTSPTPISGTPVVCQGMTTTLSDVTSGGSWTSSNTAVANVGSISGAVNGVSAGVANITYTMPVGGCYATTTATVNPLPAVNNITAPSGNSYCQGGAGVPIGMNGSVSGINYQLYDNGLTTGSPVAGSGSPFSFGMQTAAGTYSVIATNATTGCMQAMSGTQTVTINPLPSVRAVTTPDPSGSSYCAGGTGVHVGLNGSTAGINYTLSMGSTFIYSVTGTGSAFNFGLVTVAGTYTASATDPATGCSNNMTGSATISINPLPASYPVTVTGGGAYCAGGTGQHIRVSYTNSGVNYQLFNGATPVAGALVAGINDSIDFGTITAAGTYNVVGTNSTTGCQSSMSNTVNITINPLPGNSYSVTATAGNSYCAGGAGVPIGLNGSSSGINYQLLRGTTPVPGALVSGGGATVSFGNQTTAGTYTVMGIDATTGCTNTMTGSQAVTINALPVAFTVTGGGNYCLGGTGVPVGLASSEIGVDYQLLLGSSPVTGAPVMHGNGGPLSFGLYTGAGAYTVMATNTTTGCTNTMSGAVNVTINPLPATFSVTGGGNFCTGGTGVHVGLSFSNTGVTYQLYNGMYPVGAGVAGTGGPIDFGLQAATGSYSVVATNNITGCVNNMTGSATVTTSGLPTAYTVSGGGGYCAGGAGVHVTLGASNTGISYQLYNGTLPVGAAMPGTGAPLDFGLQTAGGVYTIVAVNNTTACSSNMTGSATVAVNANPTAYTVSGGGSYCAGGTGVPVGLANSDNGINYVLYLGATPASGTMTGTGSALVFGSRTTAGAYTVMATDATTGCSSSMSGTASIMINPLPTVFTVTGGGTVCSGTGSHIMLSSSNAGVNYQLSNGATPVGTAMSGTGATIDFGAQTVGGTYTVAAVDAVTGCQSPMASSAVINVLSAPTPFSVTGGGSYCAGGVGPHIGITASERTATYQLYKGATAVGIPWYGTGSAIDFGTYAIPGSYTVVAYNTAGSTCTTPMLSAASVSVTPLAVPAVSVTDTVSHTVCAGTPVSFGTSVTNGGSSPVYQWSVGGSAVAGATSSVFNYIPANGDVVSVMITSNAACATPSTANGTVTMTVNANHAPAVTIAANPGSTVCAGTPVLFTAAPSWGGTAPTYAWFKGGTVPLGTGPAITYVPSNGDNIYVNMTSNYACISGTAGTSANITMSISTPPAPVFTLSGNANVGLHVYDTLTANVTGGIAATYQWFINGTPVHGANGAVFISNDFNNRDSVSVTVTNTTDCGSATSSKYVIMNVRNLGVKQVTSNSDVRVIPNPNNGSFTVKGALASGADEEVTIEVSNMLGQVVYNGKVTAQNGAINSQVQLSNVANGTYILNLRSATEQTIFHIVVEK
jgi:hypothetical protein